MFADYVDHEYSRTRDDSSHAKCGDAPCSALVDTAKAAPCEICREWFCETHLYGGFCEKDMAVDVAAEELEAAA